MARKAVRVTKTKQIEVDEITLEGKKVKVRNEAIPIGKVKLDPRNPRIANTIAISASESGAALQERLEQELWNIDDVKQLYRQIELNRGLIERIIVRADYSAVEGNCRTVVYRKLHKKFDDDPTWERIPARVLPADIGERSISLLLGEMHVAGKNTWTAFEKAGHVHQMNKDFALTQDEIAKQLRLSKSKVNAMIRAFDALKSVYIPRFGPSAAAIAKFSYFEEFFKNPRLREWADTRNDAVQQFAGWVGEDRLTMGTQVRKLPTILANESAFAALSKKGFDAALKAVEGDDPTLNSKLFKQMSELTVSLRAAQLTDIQRVRKSGASASRRLVLDLKEQLDNFVELCGIDQKERK